MRVSRSPDDKVIEINLTSFGLKGLFGLITLVGCVLGFVLYRERIPLTNAVIYSAICAKSDWESLTKGATGDSHVEFKVFQFEARHPATLFESFRQKPQLWGEIAIDGSTYTSTGRRRLKDSPIEGAASSPFDPNLVDDRVAISGLFERSKRLNRYYIDFHAGWATSPLRKGSPFIPMPHQLRFRGAIDGEILVFAQPSENELMRLLIIDLSHKDNGEDL